jgi:hypothetical protein
MANLKPTHYSIMHDTANKNKAANTGNYPIHISRVTQRTATGNRL